MLTRSTSNRGKRPINVAVIAILVVVGVALAGFLGADGEWVGAGATLAWMLGIAILLAVFTRRSDTVAMLADDSREERNVHIHRRAALVTLNILAGVIIVAGIVDIARGGSGDPYVWLAAVGGGTYLVSLLVINRRS